MFCLHGPLRPIGRKTGARYAPLALGLLCLLSGCKHDIKDDYVVARIDRMPPSDVTIQPRIDLTTGRPMAPVSVQTQHEFLAQPGFFAQNGGLASPPDTGNLPDYVKKCDVYWKLNWMRKELLAGNVPSNLLSVIAYCRRELALTVRDGNYDLGTEALDHIELGLTHLHAAQLLVNAHIISSDIPWSGGRSSVEHASTRIFFTRANRYLRAGSVGVDSADPLGENTTARQRAMDIMLTYASRYSASPEDMARKEWQIAITKTNKLRDNLWLMGLPQNNDGNRSDINTDIASNPSNHFGNSPFADIATSASSANRLLQEPSQPSLLTGSGASSTAATDSLGNAATPSVPRSSISGANVTAPAQSTMSSSSMADLRSLPIDIPRDTLSKHAYKGIGTTSTGN